MLYQLIHNKRDQWLHSEECTIRSVLDHIVQRGMMRDAQVEAIKTYLYLKIKCQNRPLWELFSDGEFNTLDLDQLYIPANVCAVMHRDKGVAALYEYAIQPNRESREIAPLLRKYICEHADEIDAKQVFRNIFYGVNYTDYLFSLPMGAGKTFLMAAFIYLDLYYAKDKPDNPAFAHNFMVMAPAGLKTAVLPSLKNIRDFDPTWVLPEPHASEIKRMIKFEVLDEVKPGKKTTVVRNPNAQKISLQLAQRDLMGLVAVTNAEKVNLDLVDKQIDSSVIMSDEMKSEREKIRVANELRDIIQRIPRLSIFIDEVHHAGGEQKLREVVNQWSGSQNFCGMLGFSGTPYLETAKKISVGGDADVKNKEFNNVVYYYPLASGIDNFLKHPSVFRTENDQLAIIREGINMFIDQYWDMRYANGTQPKLAIYCGQVPTLEETIYPYVLNLLMERGLDTETVLKYHKGSTGKGKKKYPEPEGAAVEFAILDTPQSKKRIVLLVQIGKEGWDCKSLAGVILPHEGACPKNMVLQTSCRCLRQVERGAKEEAIIWLNNSNYKTLDDQLQKQQNTSVNELTSRREPTTVKLERHSRMDFLKVPEIEFYQLHVNYDTPIIEMENNIGERLGSPDILQKADETVVYKHDFTSSSAIDTMILRSDEVEHTTFNQWLYTIAKESFGTLTMQELRKYNSLLRPIFETISDADETGIRLLNDYNQAAVRSRIRQCFIPLRDYHEDASSEEVHFSLVKQGQPTSPCETTEQDKYYPKQDVVKQIIGWDTNPKDNPLTPEVEALLKQLEALGQDTSSMRPQSDPYPERKRTYHYLPYRFDSNLEKPTFLELREKDYVKDLGLELYFNGDDNVTDFYIHCYHYDGHHWTDLGNYYPDFLLIKRREDKIYKVMIIETKGGHLADKFRLRKQFMEGPFLMENNDHFKYDRFDFLYLEDTLSKDERTEKMDVAIKAFFNDKQE